MLRCVVLLKFCPDTAELTADPDTRAPRFAAAPWRISTFDEHALEEAVRLGERHGAEIRTLSLVPESPPRELVLTALAMGADEAHLIQDASAGEADALATARVLARALERLAPWDLVLAGEGSLDRYRRQVGPRVAEELGIPPLTQVTRLELDDGRVVAHRALEDRTEVVECEPPALITVGQEINQPRLPTVLQILGAGRKPTVEGSPADLGFPAETTTAELSRVETLEVVAPPDRRRRIPIEGETSDDRAALLARRLLEEGAIRAR
jgi:electron transfer flavoprotein beta subunit